MTRSVYRLRLAAVCMGLAAIAFLQDPGRTAADTKLDLTLDPWGFLRRAAHMWDDSAFFGQLQNQAYGYFWPVGPFFGVMRSLDVTPWVAQRLWWSVLLITAFLGCVRLLRLLGIASPPARVVAALSFALSARVITELGPVSVEAWPMALAPWLLIPLVHGARGGSPRRWAGLSGIVVLMAGGINAVATAAILPLGVLYLVTRQPGPRRRQLIGWWAVSVVLASLWWAIPLLLLGAYSPPFLDWIEGAAVTTIGTDPASLMRGTSQWVAYLTDRGGPVWLAGWRLVNEPMVIAAGFIVVGIGVVGLCRRTLPERTFLLLTLVVGLALTGLGHVAAEPWTGLFAVQIQAAMDGVLAPLRNTHKFQPLVTLPLTVAFAHALTLVPARGRSRAPGAGSLLRPAVTIGAAAGVVLVAALPALTGQVTRGRSYVALPTYWYEAAEWLNSQQSQGRGLVVPTSSFGVFLWGRTQDEPLQGMRTRSWAVRDAVPLSSAGNIRLLDEVERRLGSGMGSAGLARALDRAGVRWLLVRNDLDRERTTVTPPALVYQSLLNSPGIRSVARFGPTLYPTVADTRLADAGARIPVPAIEIFAVEQVGSGWDDRAVLRDASAITTFHGAPEALLDLTEHGLIGSEAAILAGDPLPAGIPTRQVLTDSYRRAEANFGSTTNQYSETLTSDQEWRSSRRVHDYVLDVGPPLSTAVFDGFTVRASSSGSSPFATRARSESAQPWAAVDGDPATAWVSGDFARGVGQWWEVSANEPRPLTSLRVRLVTDRRVGAPAQTLRVSTDDRSWEVPVRDTEGWQVIPLAQGTVSRGLRLELTAVEGGGPGLGFGIAELDAAALIGSRSIGLTSGEASGGVLLSARSGNRESCVTTSAAVVCHPDLGRPGEERSGIRRTLDLQSTGTYRVSAAFRPRPGSAMDARLPTLERPAVTASSSLVDDAGGRAQAAADGDARTTWIADPADRSPHLTLQWPAAISARGLRVSVSPYAAASAPLLVEITAGGFTQRLGLDDDGSATFPELDVDQIKISFPSVQRRFVPDPVSGSPVPLPVGVTELQVIGADPVEALNDDDAVEIPCGDAPSLRFDDGPEVALSASTSVGDVLSGQSAHSGECGAQVTLAAGEHTLVAEANDELLVDSVALLPVPAPAPPAPATSASVLDWSPVSRRVEIQASPHPRTLETTENYSSGWRARIGDEELVPLRVDGWRQAFLLPPGASGVAELRFEPDRTYRRGLLMGALAAMGLVILTALRGTSSSPRVGPADRAGLVLVSVLALAALAGGWLALAVGASAVGMVRVLRIRTSGAAAWRIAGTGAIGAAAILAVAMPLLPWPGRLGHEGLHTSLATALPLFILSIVAAAGRLPDRVVSVPTTGCSDSPAGSN